VKIGIIPENLVERLALALGLVSTPAIAAWFPFMLSRAILAGTSLGVFEALAARTDAGATMLRTDSDEADHGAEVRPPG
jgi:hypothetical protein